MYQQQQPNQMYGQQPVYGQQVFVQQQQGYAAGPYQGSGFNYQQQPMQQPMMVNPGMQQGYVQENIYAQPMMGVPQGFPAGNEVMVQNQQNRYLPNNANGSEFSALIRCPSCSKEINTIVENRAGGATYGWVAITCFCCFPCCFIPLFIDQCKDKIHICPRCRSEVGVCTKSMC